MEICVNASTVCWMLWLCDFFLFLLHSPLLSESIDANGVNVWVCACVRCRRCTSRPRNIWTHFWRQINVKINFCIRSHALRFAIDVDAKTNEKINKYFVFILSTWCWYIYISALCCVLTFHLLAACHGRIDTADWFILRKTIEWYARATGVFICSSERECVCVCECSILRKPWQCTCRCCDKQFH